MMKAWKRGHRKIRVFFQVQETMTSCSIMKAEEPQVEKFFERRLVKLSKSQIDDLIVIYVIESTWPSSRVEKPTFIKLVQGLGPFATVMTQKVLYSYVESKYITMERSRTELYRETVSLHDC